MDMNRYDRQERVQQIGPAGQSRINAATILIVGCGALGSYAAAQLARAGVGHLILVDPDTVSITNLQRQALFTEADAENKVLKVEAVKRHLQAINSQVAVTAIPAPFAADMVNDYQFDLALDCLDNYGARDLLNRLALANDFDYLFASCAGTYGNVMAISPRHHPCLNCLFPHLDRLAQADCDLIGVNTALIPLVAGMQVSIALHYLVDRKTVDFNHLLTVDNWSMMTSKIKISKVADCPSCRRPNTAAQKIKNTEKEAGLKMLCGEDAFYVKLADHVSLSTWGKKLAQQGALQGASPLFIHFVWDGRPVSLFKNGKLIMYQLPDSEQAQKQLTSIKAFADTIQGER